MLNKINARASVSKRNTIYNQFHINVYDIFIDKNDNKNKYAQSIGIPVH